MLFELAIGLGIVNVATFCYYHWVLKATRAERDSAVQAANSAAVVTVELQRKLTKAAKDLQAIQDREAAHDKVVAGFAADNAVVASQLLNNP